VQHKASVTSTLFVDHPKHHFSLCLLKQMSVMSDTCSQFSPNIKRLTSNKKWDICHPAMRHLPSLTGTTVVHLWCLCNSSSEGKVCHVSFDYTAIFLVRTAQFGDKRGFKNVVVGDET